jgi:hypothetical protein
MSSSLRVSFVTLTVALIAQGWLAALVVFVMRKMPALSVEVHQPSGHVSHEQLWRSLNNDEPLLGGVVDTWLIESLSLHPRVSLVHEVLPLCNELRLFPLLTGEVCVFSSCQRKRSRGSWRSRAALSTHR